MRVNVQEVVVAWPKVFGASATKSKSPRDLSAARWYGLALAIGVLVPLSLSSRVIPPLWILAAVMLIVLVVVGSLKWPAAMLVPAIFIPQWKTLPWLQSLQAHVDLTVVALAVLTIVLVSEYLAALRQGLSIRGLFAGQGGAVGAFSLFAGIVAVSYFYTPAPNWGLTQTIRLWGIGGLLFLSPFILMKRERDFRQFSVAFLCFAVAKAVETIFFPQYGKGGRIEGIVKTDIGAGWLIGMAIILLLYYPLFASRTRQLFAKLVCVPILAAGLVAATARGPILALLLVFLLVPVVSLRRIRLSALLKWAGVFALIVVGSWVSLSSLEWTKTRYEEKTQELLQIFRGSETLSANDTAIQRLDFYRAALAEIPERPILGLGVGGWAVYYTGRDVREYPHNLLLLVGVEQGLLGVLALVAFLAMAVARARRIIRFLGDRFVVLFSLVVFSVTVSMFSGDLDTNRLLWFWCGVTFAFSRPLVAAAARAQWAASDGRHVQPGRASRG